MSRAMNAMRISLVLLIILLTTASLAFPMVEAASPAVLQRFPSTGKSSLGPGAETTFSWALGKDVSEFLFYYDVSGDVLDVSIDDAPYWQSLTGRGWRFCDGCEFSAGTHDVAAYAPFGATQFYIVFYVVPQPPVDFAGFIPADSTEAFSEFGALFPLSSNYTMALGVAGGSYDFFIDDMLNATVTGSTTLTVFLEEGFHKLAVDATGLGADVTWTLSIQEGESLPRLEVAILYPESGGCNATLNPESGQSVCVVGAKATASDGGTPTITYLWTKSGGELNSTSSQWVQWTAPAGVATFALTVQASAEGYVPGSYSVSVQVVPEFPMLVVPLLLMLGLGFAAIARRRPQHPAV
jgi:hypothetical protein